MNMFICTFPRIQLPRSSWRKFIAKKYTSGRHVASISQVFVSVELHTEVEKSRQNLNILYIHQYVGNKQLAKLFALNGSAF